MVEEMGRGVGIVSGGVVDGGGLKMISVEMVVEVVGVGGGSRSRWKKWSENRGKRC